MAEGGEETADGERETADGEGEPAAAITVER